MPYQKLQSILKNTHAVLWDFDGCFANTEQLHFQAYRIAFAEFGYDLVEDGYYYNFTHLGEGAAKEIEKHNLKINLDAVMAAKKQAYDIILNQKNARVFEQTPAILQCFKNMNCKQAIASNSPASEINLILSYNTLPVTLDTVIGKMGDLRKKPAPDIFKHAMETLNVEAKNTLVLEDSQRGLEAAMHAGCSAIWIRTPQNADLKTEIPHIISLTHTELLHELKKFNDSKS